MSTSPNVVIVMARCGRTRQSFGIRLEEYAPRQWGADWAFAVKEDAARREGYDRAVISGSFGFADTYPGCPSCHAKSLFKCSCGGVACCPGEAQTVHCPWCGEKGEISGSADSLSVGGDR